VVSLVRPKQKITHYPLTLRIVDSHGTSGKLIRMSSQRSACSTKHGGDAMDDGYGYLTLTAPEAAPCA
jgi:hypothetical protein